MGAASSRARRRRSRQRAEGGRGKHRGFCHAWETGLSNRAVKTGRFPIPAPAAAGWAFQMQSPENTVGVTGPYSGQQTRNGVTGHPRGSSWMGPVCSCLCTGREGEEGCYRPQSVFFLQLAASHSGSDLNLPCRCGKLTLSLPTKIFKQIHAANM